MTTGPSSRRLRLWPAVVILALAAGVLAWIWLPADSPVGLSQPTLSLVTLLLAALLLALWWLLASGARWRTRLAVLAALALAVWAASFFVELRGLSGDLLPQLAWRGTATPAPLPAPAASAAAAPSEPPTATPATDDDPAAAQTATTETPASPAAAAATPVTGARPSSPEFSQFLGPSRNATLTGVRLSREWDRTPPEALWRQPIGAGWAGFAVAEGLAVTQEQRNGTELVVAYDLASGVVRWSHRGGSGFSSTMAGDGPRATPTLHDGRVYTFGVRGILRAFELTSGRLLFERDVLAENGAESPVHGVAASPLIVDGLVVVLAGGSDGRSLVAYDAVSGERRWSGGDDPAAYSSPLLATLGGVRQIVVFNRRHLTGHDPATGAVLWRDAPWPRQPEKVSQPVLLGDDRVFASMGYGVGARLLQVSLEADGSFEARTLWESKGLKAKFTQVVAHEGFLYGLDEGVLVCLDPASGERRWKSGRYGHGQVLLVGELLLVQSESGELLLIDPDPERLVELAHFQAVEGRAWATPALAGDLLIVRGDVEVACYRLPTETGAASAGDSAGAAAGVR